MAMGATLPFESKTKKKEVSVTLRALTVIFPFPFSCFILEKT